MSAKKPRRAGAPAFPEKRPGLRLLKNPEEHTRAEPDLELKAALDDIKRRQRIQREQIEREPDDKDAA